jgi:hypothetical protein
MTNTYTRPSEYWDQRALSGVGMAECGPLHISMLAWLCHHSSDNDKVLEVGTGDGRIYEYISMMRIRGGGIITDATYRTSMLNCANCAPGFA